MSTNLVDSSPAVSRRSANEPRWTPPRAAVHAALTLQFAADMYNLLDSSWIIALNADGGALYPLAAFGAHPEPDEIARAIARTNEPAPCTTCSLLVHGRTAGVLALGPKRNFPAYTPSDLNLLAEAAAHIGALIEDERLSWYLASKIIETERARRELETAREVQNRFFPTRFSAVKGIDYYGECEPSGVVGGDFFDFTPLSDNGLAIAIGNVSGHDVPAAIVMAALQAALRSISANDAARPAQIVAELNRLVCDLCPDNLYANLFYARIDPEKRFLTYVNAGREPALLLRSDARRQYRLDAGGAVLGLTRHSNYEQAEIPLHGGDTLVAFTEGLTEAANADRIAGYLRAHAHAGARDLVMEILQEAGDFSSRFDDRTAVAARIGKAEERTPVFAIASWERERIAEMAAA